MSAWVEGTTEQLANYYPQFTPVSVPDGSTALRAWEGVLRPLKEGSDLRGIFSHFMDRVQSPVTVLEGGVLEHPAACRRHHGQLGSESLLAPPFPSFLLLLLDFGPVINPRVHCLSPEISRRRFPAHPHLRDDHTIFLGRTLQALCLYLASDGVLPRNDMTLVAALDFASFFLAKHVVWSRSLRWETVGADKAYLLTADSGGLLWAVKDHDVLEGTHAINAGFYRSDGPTFAVEDPEAVFHGANRPLLTFLWPGPFAPHTQEELVAQIDPDSECPCGKGIRYRDCCLPEHRKLMAEERRPNARKESEVAPVVGRSSDDPAPGVQRTL